ncbi:MAG: C1 family peptidase [Bacteroidales bacterium]|nr:C1 family peptidase [Bacteroidales bacterium]
MKKTILLFSILLVSGILFSQKPVFDQSISIGQTFTTDTELFPFNGQTLYGAGVNGNITFNSDSSLVRIIVGNGTGLEYMIYETYPMLDTVWTFTFNEECEETCFLEGFAASSIIIQITDASPYFSQLKWSGSPADNPQDKQLQAKTAKGLEKIEALNAYIQSNNLVWEAGETPYSDLFYQKKKELMNCAGNGSNKFNTYGYEYYSKGIFGIGPAMEAYAKSTSNYVETFDWRKQHDASSENSSYYDGDMYGSGWITPPKCQSGCWYNNEWICDLTSNECTAMGGTPISTGACVAFGTLGQLEAIANLYFNDHIDLDLSEQHLISCNGGLNGTSATAHLYYIKNNYVVDEDCFPWQGVQLPCTYVCPNPGEMFTFTDYQSVPKTEEDLRGALIESGPINIAGFYSQWGLWSHDVVLVGYDILEIGDEIPGMEPITFDHPYIGFPYWIYKDSGGLSAWDNGFAYMFWPQLPISRNKLVLPVTSLQYDENDIVCADKDNDGYYNWGIGNKPSTCPECPDLKDGNDNDPSRGPMDEHASCWVINDYSTSFEVDFDGWMQSDADDLDWLKSFGSTPTEITGPDLAQDGEFYIYVDASYTGIGYPKKTAIIESPIIKIENACAFTLNFWFHKLGPNGWGHEDSKFELQVSYDEGINWQSNVWNVGEDFSSPDWTEVSIVLPSTVNKLRFIVTTGNTQFNDMALDNVSISPVNGLGDPVVIEGNEIWDETHQITDGIVINNGASLTLEANCTLYMYPGSKIIVKPTATLMVDGAMITSGCNEFWKGIEVWGNPASPYPLDQGWLTIKNGAVIENAKVGIRNHHYNDELAPPDGHQGGIVKAFYSTFRNNKKTMDLRNYAYNSYNYVKDCEFIYDDNYLDSNAPGYFIEARYMKGISIISSDFSNITTEAYNGRGIYSYKTNIAVKGKCISLTEPCSEWENSTFNNLMYGIYAMDNAAGKYVDIRNSTFNQCQKGVYISGMDGARVTSNEFNVPQFYAFDIENYGLYLNNSTAYHVEDNDFFGPSPSQKGGIGVYVNNSGTSWNQIYNNRFENLRQATLAYGINRGGNETGLCIKCNDYQHNSYDIIVNGVPHSINQGIARYQGSPVICDTCPAGNTFSADADYNYYNADGMGFLTYIYHGQYLGLELLRPLTYYSIRTMNLLKNLWSIYNKEISCPSKLANSGGIGIDIMVERNALAEANNIASQKDAQLEAWVDAGDTESLNFEVLMSSPPKAGEVYQGLMNQTPFLSDTVLKTAIYKEDVLVNAMIRDVLVASPQAAKNNELLDAINERFEPMPQWMKDQVLEGVNLLGAKESLEAERATWKHKRGEHFNNLYQYFRRDTLDPAALDSLKLLLTNDPYPNSKFRLAFLYYQAHDYNSMNSMLVSIPFDFELTLQQQLIHQDYLTLFGVLEQLSGNELLLDSIQAIQLESLIQRDYYFPGAYARDLLFATGFIDYQEPVVIPEILKSSEIYGNEKFSSHDAPEILNVFPNPASDYVVVEYNTAEYNGDVLLSIVDLAGKHVFSEVQNSVRNQKVISTNGWKSGVYLVTISVNGATINSRKLTIQ